MVDWGLLIFGFACKELGSHHSALTAGEKLNRLKNKQFFLIHNRGMTQGTPPPSRLEGQTGEYRKSQLTRADTH